MRFALALLVLIPTSAFARDHQELVCSGIAEPKDVERMPIFVHFFESRAKDGESRDERLSSVYQGKLFQGARVNKSGDPSKDAPITLSSGKQTRFKGTYTLEHTGDTWTMKLAGKLTADPSAKKPEYTDITVALPCVDLSI
jgi:hypothetical protein